MTALKDIKDADCIVLAVAHDAFKDITLDKMNSMFKECPQNEKVVIDVKSILNKTEMLELGYCYWRL